MLVHLVFRVYRYTASEKLFRDNQFNKRFCKDCWEDWIEFSVAGIASCAAELGCLIHFITARALKYSIRASLFAYTWINEDYYINS